MDSINHIIPSFQVESFMMSYEHTLLNRFHRQIFCWTDRWFGMTIDDIRALEDKTRRELEDQRKSGQVRGSMPKK